ncbi:MAG TPA: endo-1,4-beta-xylanase [Chthoniobacteraceae bacterium]|nr:endo-1,4-beta-xylanase [Chthoniobacteraceae bacterium]
MLLPVLLLMGFQSFAADTIPVPAGQRLKILGAGHHLLIGGATDLDHHDPEEEQIVKREYSILSTENLLKPHSTEPQKGVFRFKQTDAFVKFCMDNGLVAKGHVLLGRNRYLPEWMKDPKLTPDELKDNLIEHITNLMGRYKKGSPYGHIQYWDVLNEEINGASPYQRLGKDADGDYLYWDLAFRTARAVDPDCVLIWNEDNIENNPKKADKLYKAIKQLKANGVPVDGVGFQCHIGYNHAAPPDYDYLAKTFQRFADLGLFIVVSEMDVPGTLDQADIYRKIVAICVNQPKCIIWDTWNVVDKYSWRRNEGPSNLLFDDNYEAKPAYYAVQAALSGGGAPAMAGAADKNPGHP